MTLVPEVERELSRVAHAPQPSATPQARRPRRILGVTSLLVGVAVPIVVVVLVLVLSGSHHPVPQGQSASPTRGAAAPVPIRNQPGTWRGGATTCPRAPRMRGLPADVGCVSVVHADVDGDGRTDTAILYATLSSHRYGTRYAPTAFWLVVRRASGAELRTRLPQSDSNAFFLQHGNLNGVPGDELIVELERWSSGSLATIYTATQGHLRREPVFLEYRGDSTYEAGFVCRTGAHPEVIQHIYALQRSLRWRDTTTTFVWQGATLHRTAHHAKTTAPSLGAGTTTLSRSCGAFDVPPSSLR
jgi:hypothetical protein